MKFALSLVIIGLFFVVSRYVANLYFPDHEFVVGWFAGTLALIIGSAFD